MKSLRGHVRRIWKGLCTSVHAGPTPHHAPLKSRWPGEEIEALDWVTAEQKVTTPEPTDHDVYGWPDGTLVRFAIRGGRLTGWIQRARGQATARRHLASTPTQRVPFAQRNAELAARLAHGTEDAAV